MSSHLPELFWPQGQLKSADEIDESSGPQAPSIISIYSPGS